MSIFSSIKHLDAYGRLTGSFYQLNLTSNKLGLQHGVRKWQPENPESVGVLGGELYKWQPQEECCPHRWKYLPAATSIRRSPGANGSRNFSRTYSCRACRRKTRDFNLRHSSRLDSDTLDVYNALHFNDEADRKSLKKTLEMMENHYVGELNIVYERYMFFQRSQWKDESFQSYLNAIRALAGTCDFKDLHDVMVRDRIVCGIANITTQRQLLQKENLTLEVCIELCRAVEASATYIERMHEPCMTSFG